MIPIEIKEKLDKVRGEYLDADSQKMVDDIEKTLEKRIAASELKDNEIVKVIIEDALKRVEDISFILSNEETLTTEQRTALYSERKAHRFWLKRFGYEAESYVRSVEKFLDEKLSTA